MNDYSQWKEKSLAVTSLLLDSRNPRIPDLGHVPTQREIVADLVEHEDVTVSPRALLTKATSPLKN